MKNFVEELTWRGMIHTMMPGTEEQLMKEQTSAYVGIDPTADSLHIGHLVSIMMLKHFQNCGHKPYALIGGATGMIGDPSMKSAERNLLDEQTLNHNIAAIKKQLSKFLDFDSDMPNAAVLVNNYDWMKDFSFLSFIRDIGKHITVNYMMSKDSVKKRLTGEAREGMSFTEFSYQLVQGYDFLYLNEHKNCKLQMGGSDQWGNITTGVDLIRKVLEKPAYAFTMPLILDSTGKKFGKSEGNALWLNKEKTSAYEIYQYLINSDDSKVLEYLKVFTFLSKEQIEEVYAKQLEAPETRIAQKTLAWEVVKDIHGKEEADNAVLVSEKLFKGDFNGLSVKDIKSGMRSVPSFDLTEEGNIVDVLVNNKIASSKREAREFIKGNAISVNGNIINDETATITKDMAIEGEIIIFRRGKKKYFIGNVK